MSGKALLDAGYNTIVATDRNLNMLQIAKKKKLYSKLYNPEEFDFLSQVGETFPHIFAVGVISSGAGPASLLLDILNLLESGGYLCFSFNDHTLSDQLYISTLEDVKASGLAKEVFKEHGHHLVRQKIRSTVYILRKS